MKQGRKNEERNRESKGGVKQVERLRILTDSTGVKPGERMRRETEKSK